MVSFVGLRQRLSAKVTGYHWSDSSQLFRKRTGYSKAYLVWMMLVIYNTRLGSIDVQEKNLLFKGLFSLVDVSLKIRKEGFYWKLLVLFFSGKDFQPK